MLLEAMAVGKAVIASRIYGISDTVQDGRTGILVEPGSPVQLGDAIGRLIDDPSECREMGAAARRIYEGMYTAGCFGDRMAELYTKVSGKAG